MRCSNACSAPPTAGSPPPRRAATGCSSSPGSTKARSGAMAHPFFERASRPHIEGRFAAEELGLAAINASLPPEALRYDVTPVGLHYTLSHFDIPAIDAAS